MAAFVSHWGMPAKTAAPSPARAGGLPGISKGDLSLPAFKPLRELATVTDDDELRRQMLARLDDIYDRAVKRERTVGRDQAVVLDPDGNTATKVVEVAAGILGVKVKAKPLGAGTAFDPAVFSSKPEEAA